MIGLNQFKKFNKKTAGNIALPIMGLDQYFFIIFYLFSFSPGRTFFSQHFILTSTLYFQSAAVPGRRNAISQPAQSPARWWQCSVHSGSGWIPSLIFISYSQQARLCKMQKSYTAFLFCLACSTFAFCANAPAELNKETATVLLLFHCLLAYIHSQ